MAASTGEANRSFASPVRIFRGGAWRSRLWPESGAVSPIPALDGLRAVAALLVLLHHAWTILPNYIAPGENAAKYPLWYGKTGVDLFFVLSGFLLFLPYAQWVFGLRGRPETHLFYKRRALRVVPAYWASLIIIVALHGAAALDVLVHVVFLQNTSWLSVFSINGVYWTMAIEVQFYVLLPLIGWCMATLARRIGAIQAAVVILLGMVGISALSTYLTHIGSVDLSTTPVVSTFLVQYAATPFWLATFACGIACSLLYTYVTKVRVERMRSTLLVTGVGNAAFVLGLTLLALLTFVPLAQIVWMPELMFGIGYAGVLLGVLFGSSWLRWPFASRPLRFVGLISYSFYIWHHAALLAIAPRLHGALVNNYHTVVLFVAGLTLSLPIAYVSYQLFERPFITARVQAHETKQAVVEEKAAAQNPIGLGLH